MAYATAQDITYRYGEDALYIAADRDNDDAIDQSAVDVALDDASAEIDGYLGQRYTLPINTPPKLLVMLCVDISLYKMSTGTSLTEEQRIRYEDALKKLERISKGIITLGLPSGDEQEASEEVEIEGPERQFSRAKMNRIL